MALPDVVVNYLQAALLEQSAPFCAELDEQYRVVRSWGSEARFGLAPFAEGDDLREPAPFLVGMPLDRNGHLSFVTLPGGNTASMHLIPENDVCFLVLLDVAQEHAEIQQRQQSVNELRLVQNRQQRLIARQRELISELVEARSALDHHRREAERTSENKSKFIGMMSHEFRTPLASIIYYADLAAEPESDDDDIQKCVETISRSARHLSSLVETLLDDASLEAGRLELVSEEFDLVALLDDIASMMAPLAADKGLSFAVRIDESVPKTVNADGIRLRQVLINLLGNAVKFTEDGGVELLVAHNAGRLVTTVSDTGPGISLADQERVFQAFERGGSHQHAGAGLGLSITLQLVKLMRGEVSLDSAPGEGCTVSVHVPVVAVADEGRTEDPVLAAPSDSARATKSLSVMICDDDEDMIALIGHYLHRAGYGLTTSQETSEAIEKALRFDPDLILMDCNVPGVGGVVASKILRERGYKKPIVALTASKLSDAERQVFTRVFRKPASMHELLAEVKKLTH
ncbi:MAG: ATP-binding protein [Pseudomonadota bacterium]